MVIPCQMLIGKYADYREFLKDELESRIRKNARYSLRAFARDLDVAPQILSSVMKGKKGISSTMASRWASQLGLNIQETSYLCNLVDLIHARSDTAKQIATLRISRYHIEPKYASIREDVFRMISDWYHYAILELTLVQDFRSDPKWIAKALSISAHEAEQAIKRLKRLGLLVGKGNSLKKTTLNLTTTHEVPSEAIRQFNRQILVKASEALTFQTIQERDFTTMTLASTPKKLAQAKERIRKFRRKLTEFLEEGEQTEVYCLAFQLFRLSSATQKGLNS